MILLNEIANKIESVLNGTDSETQQYVRPTDFEFGVETSGYHLDHIYDSNTGKNFLPVFISSMGGSYDPVIGVKRNTYNVSITIYFPVSYKEQMYTLTDYLVNCFVGTIRNYGSESGKCLSNISVPEYGEIQDLDLRQFQNWVQNVYQKQIDVMQPYMTMTFVLYLVNAGTNYIFGNSVEYTLKFTVNNPSVTFRNTETRKTNRYYRNRVKDKSGTYKYAWTTRTARPITLYSTTETPSTTMSLYDDQGVQVAGIITTIYQNETLSENLKWTSSGTGVDNSPASQQLIGVDKYAKNVINITNYSKSIAAYVEDNDFWNMILDYYNRQEINDLYSMEFKKTYHLASGDRSYTYNQVALSLNENIALGDLLSMTITFGDKI